MQGRPGRGRDAAHRALEGGSGWDRLLDHAAELVRADIARPGHRHRVNARSKNARIDFDTAMYSPWDPLCPELFEVLGAIEDASQETSELCGSPGEERPEHSYHTYCTDCAARVRAEAAPQEPERSPDGHGPTAGTAPSYSMGGEPAVSLDHALRLASDLEDEEAAPRLSPEPTGEEHSSGEP